MSIADIAAEILARLTTIDGVRTCADWGGNIDEAIKNATRLPAIYLICGAMTFQPKTVLGGGVIVDHNDIWTVVVCAKDLRAQDAAKAACYSLVESVTQALAQFPAGSGWLWPVTAKLIHSDGGVMAYAIDFTTEQEDQY